jgi:ribonuclease HI
LTDGFDGARRELRGMVPAGHTLAPSMTTTQPHVELYTDGACSGNPGPGGWGYILKHPATAKEKEASGAEAATTNNRMELMAVIQGLSALKSRSAVDLYSDSLYVLKGLKEWMKDWKARGWKTSDKKPVKNRELWEQLDELVGKHEVRFHWIRGHSEHPENERADRLAVAAREALAGGRP